MNPTSSTLRDINDILNPLGETALPSITPTALHLKLQQYLWHDEGYQGLKYECTSVSKSYTVTLTPNEDVPGLSPLKIPIGEMDTFVATRK